MRADVKHLAASSLLCFLAACGKSSESNDGPAAAVDFPVSLISEFSSWTPVLNGDLAFASLGHGGQTVRVYFNEVAKPYFTGERALPFAEGSIVAKAVVAGTSSPVADASKVYFMKKKVAGFDPENADWSYAEATGSVGSLSFSGKTGALSSCFSCHKLEKEWDYVRTVDYHKTQIVSE